MRFSQSITYIDPTTLAGASALLENPSENINAFTLLDLMACTEAFAFYDYLYSFWNGAGLIESKAQAVSSVLGRQMKNSELRMIKKMHVALSNEFEDYWSSLEYFDCERFEKIFSPFMEDLKSRMPVHIYNPENTYGMNDFDSINGTFHYIFHSVFMGAGYSPSLFKIPIVRLLKLHINKKISDAVFSCLNLATDKEIHRIKFVKNMFYESESSVVIPPVFRLVLRKCSGSEDFLSTLYRFRNSRITKKFRKWLLKLQKRTYAGKMYELKEAVSELNSLAKSYSVVDRSRSHHVLEFIPTGVVGFESTLAETGAKRSNQAIEGFIHPHVILFRKLDNSIQSLVEDLELIEKKFQVEISFSLLKELEMLRTFENNLSKLALS